jgi:hypothetical protein
MPDMNDIPQQCSDPFARLERQGENLVISGARPGSYLVEWCDYGRFAGHFAVLLDLATGRAIVVEQPEDIRDLYRDLGASSQSVREYLPASGVCGDQKRRERFLREHPEIRTHQPLTKNGDANPHRLMVNIADWCAAGGTLPARARVRATGPDIRAAACDPDVRKIVCETATLQELVENVPDGRMQNAIDEYRTRQQTARQIRDAKLKKRPS